MKISFIQFSATFIKSYLQRNVGIYQKEKILLRKKHFGAQESMFHINQHYQKHSVAILFVVFVITLQPACGFLAGFSPCSSCMPFCPFTRCCQTQSCTTVTRTTTGCCSSCCGVSSTCCTTTQITTTSCCGLCCSNGYGRCSGCASSATCAGCEGFGTYSNMIIPNGAGGCGGSSTGGCGNNNGGFATNGLPVPPSLSISNSGYASNGLPIPPPLSIPNGYGGTIVAYPITPVQSQPLPQTLPQLSALPQLHLLPYNVRPPMTSLPQSSILNNSAVEEFNASANNVLTTLLTTVSATTSGTTLLTTTVATTVATESPSTSKISTTTSANNKELERLEISENIESSTVKTNNNERTTGLEPFAATTPPSGSSKFNSPATVFDDLYDDDSSLLLSQNLLAADISSDYKKGIASNVFEKRSRYFNKLKNRFFRQFSAPSLADRVLPSETVNDKNKDTGFCNNYKLARVMVKAMVSDVSISKRLIRKATEISFKGKKFNVFCASGDFSYSIYAEQYCEATRKDITCFAYS